MGLRVEAWAAIIAFITTAAFIVWPNPYFMALFAFFAQPLFMIVALLYLRRVFRELRKKDVL
ncbi:MAG: hypothetical protein IH851_00815 [Armatimonadetes bacterium]|nr:hypothetical protein [Armatimonadota bacterium]